MLIKKGYVIIMPMTDDRLEEIYQVTGTKMYDADYKVRMVAEYFQLETRASKLSTFIGKYKRNELDFTPSCSIDVLQEQLTAMTQYLQVLTKRIQIENIDIDEIIKDF